MTTNSPHSLRVTEANHQDDAFWTMNGADFNTAQERDANYDSIPSIEQNPDADIEYTVDKLDTNGSLLEEKFITQATAEKLTGRTVEAMRAESKERNEAQRTRLLADLPAPK